MATRIPKFTWGPAYANVLNCGFPLDNPTCYSEPRDGSETGQSTAGYEDAWTTGTDQYLEGDIRWIPKSDTTTPAVATGWDGTTGFNAFLAWMRDKNQARFFPDNTSGTYQPVYLVEPLKGKPVTEMADGTRKISIKLRTADQSPFTGY